MDFLRRLWGMARFWPDPGMGLRTGSNSAVLAMFFILLFTVIGSFLVALGFDLDRLDLWLARQTWIGIIGELLFRGLLAFIMLICVVVLLGFLFDRGNPERPGWGMLLGAALVAWFVGATLFAPLESLAG